MKQLKSMVWKEWREVRVYLWIAIGVFIGLPIIEGMEDVFQHTAHRFEISASPWVVTFGGVLGIFVAVGATCRDFSGHLEDFWRSRPVGIVRWLLVKYLVGLAVVLVACVLPLALELRFNREKIAMVLIVWFPTLLAALYSIGFLSGCLLRRTAHAAMLALAAMLLLYFLPIVFPPLDWMSFTNIDFHFSRGSEWPDLWFAPLRDFDAGMLVLAVVVLALALFAARRGWRIESGRKMMYGSISCALLIVFASAAFKLGTNLPILQQVDLPNDEWAVELRVDGGHGFVLTTRQPNIGGVDRQWIAPEYFYRPIEVNDSGIELGSPKETEPYFGGWYFGGTSSPPEHPEIEYRVLGTDPTETGKEVYTLSVASFDKGTGQGGQRLWKIEVNPDMKSPRAPNPVTYVWQNRLYVIGSHLATFDISEPLKPRMISDVPFQYPDYNFDLEGMDKFTLNLPPVPDLPPRERLKAALERNWGWRGDVLEGDIYCRYAMDVSEYHLTKLGDTIATFEKVGQYQPTMLDKVFGEYGNLGMKLQNGLLYTSQWAGRGPFNPHISVFGTRGAQLMRVIGHFAAPGAEMVCPLPDGRALVAGSKLWLVGPPPRHGAD